MQKWEYMAVRIWDSKLWWINDVEQYGQGKGPHISVSLKQWGDEGWEVCGVAGSSYDSYYTVFLKRPKP